MKINSNSRVCKLNCYKPGQIRISYDRNNDKIWFSPCCSLFLKNYIEPLAFDYDTFYNNMDHCFERYKNFDLTNVSKYYYGRCEQVYPYGPICSGYTYNKYDIMDVDLAVYKNCNLRCAMCTMAKHTYDERESRLHFKILNYFKYKNLNKILYTSLGEPFLFKDIIFDFLENSNIKKHEIITNARLLTENDINRLAKYRDKLIIAVSCDGTSKEIYENIRIGSDFNIVLNNIILLKKLNLIQRVNYVMQDRNLIEHDKVIPFFKNLGIHLVTLIDGSFDLVNKHDLLDKNLLNIYSNYSF